MKVVLIAIFALLLFIQLADRSIASIVCKNGQRLCGGLCYNSLEQTCFDGVICNNGEHLCGRLCYDPLNSICYKGLIKSNL